MISFASAVLLALLALLQQLDLPAPRGHLSDFAGVVPADRAARIEAIAREVREKSGGEIAIAVLADIAGRAPNDVATQIGRQWKVGAATQIGDRTRNAGTVIFEDAGEGHTHVRVRIQYLPVGGKLGDAIAKLLGENPAQQVEEDLNKFKHLMESGETESVEGHPTESFAR